MGEVEGKAGRGDGNSRSQQRSWVMRESEKAFATWHRLLPAEAVFATGIKRIRGDSIGGLGNAETFGLFEPLRPIMSDVSGFPILCHVKRAERRLVRGCWRQRASFFSAVNDKRAQNRTDGAQAVRPNTKYL